MLKKILKCVSSSTPSVDDLSVDPVEQFYLTPTRVCGADTVATKSIAQDPYFNPHADAHRDSVGIDDLVLAPVDEDTTFTSLCVNTSASNPNLCTDKGDRESENFFVGEDFILNAWQSLVDVFKTNPYYGRLAGSYPDCRAMGLDDNVEKAREALERKVAGALGENVTLENVNFDYSQDRSR